MQERLTTADHADTPRAAAARLTLSPVFQRVVVGLILLNAVTLGLENSEAVMERWGGALELLDAALLWVFSAELALRVYAFRGRFFRDPWGLFDLAVVGIAWLPATGALSVLRALRILRVLRLVSVVPSLRTVVEAMLAALPGAAPAQTGAHSAAGAAPADNGTWEMPGKTYASTRFSAMREILSEVSAESLPPL